MKILVLSTLFGLIMIYNQAMAQQKIHVNDCVWINQSIIEGPDGLPIDNYEIGPGPDGYYLFFKDATEMTLLMEGELENGQRQGEWKFYNTDGTLYFRCHYANGLLNGLYEVFNVDGTVSISMQMLNDSPAENY
ncbi:MAG: toxin-antitoxin system YwqK family antitoxin [Bacteroidales bacterium]